MIREVKLGKNNGQEESCQRTDVTLGSVMGDSGKFKGCLFRIINQV